MKQLIKDETMTSIIFKIYYALYRCYLYFLFNINHQLYMKKYIPFLIKCGVNINGNPRFIHYNVEFDSTDKFSLIELNDNCVITGRTLILTHDYSIYHASIGTKKIKKSDPEFCTKGKVIIEENAFVGARCIILPNVTIGKNSIVGAGSIVTKNIPENTIVGGNPARIIKSIEDYTS